MNMFHKYKLYIQLETELNNIQIKPLSNRLIMNNLLLNLTDFFIEF